MFIDSIQLIQYRNYSRQNVRFKNGVNIFVGENGQGKTNLLEAIYALTTGSSFRPGTTESLINRQADSRQAVVQGIVENKGMKSLVRLDLNNNKKQITLNQKKTNSSQLLKNFPLVIFSPESLSSIKEGPEQRRQLVDDWLITQSLSNIKILQNFRKVLRNRNRLLKTIKKKEIDEEEGFRLLSAMNQLFLEKAVELVMVRMDALDCIEPLLAECMREITGQPLENVDISVDYIISGESARNKSRDWVFNALNRRITELSQREIESGHSLVGPQKHDIQFLFNGEDSRFFCSQGQQRALILSFKMAQIMYHYRVFQSYPILLLDDVLSELDLQKRANLIEFLKGVNSQIFITTTELSFPQTFEEKEIAVFDIADGKIVKNSFNENNEERY